MSKVSIGFKFTEPVNSMNLLRFMVMFVLLTMLAACGSSATNSAFARSFSPTNAWNDLGLGIAVVSSASVEQPSGSLGWQCEITYTKGEPLEILNALITATATEAKANGAEISAVTPFSPMPGATPFTWIAGRLRGEWHLSAEHMQKGSMTVTVVLLEAAANP